MNNILEKAKAGVYKDTPKNKKLGRVGQRYGSEKTVEEFRDKQAKLQGEYSAFINDIAKEFGGDAIIAPPKSLKRLAEKVNDDYDGDFTKAKDILRSTIIVDRDKVQDMMTSFSERFDKANSKNFIVKAIADFESDAYQGANFVIEFKGYAVEIQANTPVNLALKDDDAFLKEHPALKNTYQMLEDAGIETGKGHKYYDRIRSSDTKAEDKPKIDKEMVDYYKKRFLFTDRDKIIKDTIKKAMDYLRNALSEKTDSNDVEALSDSVYNLSHELELQKSIFDEKMHEYNDIIKSNPSEPILERIEKALESCEMKYFNERKHLLDQLAEVESRYKEELEDISFPF